MTKRKSPGLYNTRPGVCRLQVYLPERIVDQLVAIATCQNKSVSRVAAEMLELVLDEYAAYERVLGAPAETKSQGKLA